MKVLDILFGKRHFMEDNELGKFYTEKVRNLKTPVQWKQHAEFPNQNEKLHLYLQGDTREIYPNVKSAYLDFINNYKIDYFPFIEEKVKDNRDILSFENLNFVFTNILGEEKKGNSYLTIVGREYDQNFLLNLVLKNGKIETIKLM